MSTFANIFVKQLTDDLTWREAELAVMRKQIALAAVGSLQEKVFLRAGLAMVYAHYEGFCKFGLGVYIDALEKLNLKRTDLKWPLATFSLGRLHRDLLKKSDQTEFFSLLFSTFEQHVNATAEYDRPPQIANLWPDLLVEWLTRLNLESTNVSGQHTLLKSLVDNRNQIAHGKKLTISSLSDLDKFFHAATLAMHEVAVGISDALEKKSYKRSAAVHTIFGHAV